MKRASSLIIIAAALTLFSSCTSDAHNSDSIDSGLTRRCASLNGDERVAIKVFDHKAASVCAVGEDEDCLYSRTFGKTYEHSTPDLNFDGRADAVIKDFSGAYGQHDVVHFMVFAQCGDGSYIKVAEDMLQDIVAVSLSTSAWTNLEVTRTCFNPTINTSQTRHFELKFDRQKFRYGPPNNDPELMEYCSDKEMSLPSEGLPPQ